MSLTAAAKTWLARHAQTLVGSIGRLAQQPLAASMTMGAIAVALALPLALGVFLENVRAATAGWNQTVDLAVYMDKKVPASQTAALAKQLRERPDVAAVRVITAAEALAQFRTDSGFGAALDALHDNPLPDTLVVTPALTASTLEGVGTLRRVLVTSPGVGTVQVDTEWVERLHALLDILRRVVSLTAVLLGVGVVLMVGNTIRLDIVNRRAEIEVMKLVGASDGFARRPFLYSGLWYGGGGGLLALVLVKLAVASLAKPVGKLAALYGSQFHLQGLGWSSGLRIWVLAAGLGWLGSWVSASRHIRAIEPS